VEEDKPKQSASSTDVPGPDRGDFAGLLVAGVQDLLGASEEDAHRWREQLVEKTRPRREGDPPAPFPAPGQILVSVEDAAGGPSRSPGDSGKLSRYLERARARPLNLKEP